MLIHFQHLPMKKIGKDFIEPKLELIHAVRQTQVNKEVHYLDQV